MGQHELKYSFTILFHAVVACLYFVTLHYIDNIQDLHLIDRLTGEREVHRDGTEGSVVYDFD